MVVFALVIWYLEDWNPKNMLELDIEKEISIAKKYCLCNWHRLWLILVRYMQNIRITLF